ncbi:aldehyde dehydrogenase, Fe-S subunit [Mesorhizobium escarrei]|uniref:Aldehyde dehydrogenase, Fe-S subunit n=2 Tax=Mesorhizobium escarrei TaxID=666018 RepID=A0ABN8K761_9HYPH|nr:aldehyde dehydrogenase, Fe-S subunit [Mesorhizobium escarrei]
MSPIEITRRALLEGTAATAMITALPDHGASAQQTPTGGAGESELMVRLQINGKTHSLDLDIRSTLVDTLRERLGLTGTKKGCDRGECGACTVHIEGRRVLACMTLAAAAEGKEITTIEGLADGDTLHPVQSAFIGHDAFQCGFCTSGQIMSAVACIREGHAGTEADIREFMSGNLCRCSAYPQIVAAVKSAAQIQGI